MNNHLTGNDDELDAQIDRHLCDAHAQVRIRKEWADQVLRQIADEIHLQNHGAKPQSSSDVVHLASCPQDTTSQKTGWQRTATLASTPASTWVTSRATTLAASLLIGVLSLTWLAFQNNRQLTEQSSESVVVQLPAEPLEIQLRATPQPLIRETSDSVTAESGYLAAKIFEDSEFEIHVVLPSRSHAVPH